MPKNKNIIAGIIFFVIVCLIIFFSGFSPMVFPTQQDQTQGQYVFAPIIRTYILKQSFTLKKDYLEGVDVLLMNQNRFGGLDNVILITDTNYSILATVKFSSENIFQTHFYPFKFNKKVKIGKRQKCFILIYSIQGTQGGSVGLGMLNPKEFAPVTVFPMQNEDVLNSLKNPGQPFDKCICFRTYESDFQGFSVWQLPLYFLGLMITLVIIFFQTVRTWITRIKIVPERIYLSLAVVFGLALVFITPPFQVPDEQVHFYRAYQVAEFNFFPHESTIPKSLIKLYNSFYRLQWSTIDKTSVSDIKSQKAIKLEENIREDVSLSDLILPFVPQATGIFIGKIFQLPPLYLFYLSRLFNLIFSVLLLFLAIKITPVFKWIFILLGLMPMTVYLLSSSSHDTLTISLSFFLTALCLNYIYKTQKLSNKNLLLLLSVSFLLALCKPPYFMIAALSFLIPVRLFGSGTRYALFMVALVIFVMAGFKFNMIKDVFPSKPAIVSSSLNASPQNVPPKDTARVSRQLSDFDKTNTPSNIDGTKQRQFILNNPFAFVKVFFNTLFNYSGTFYLETFIGKLGWLLVPLPYWLRSFYLSLIILTSFLLSEAEIKIKWLHRLFFLTLFLLIMMFIGMGLYIVWSTVGGPAIEGIQGRYFIPLAPLLFFISYNRLISNKLNLFFSPRKKNLKKLKKAEIPIVKREIVQHEILFSKYYMILLTICTCCSLIYVLYIVADRFYFI